MKVVEPLQKTSEMNFLSHMNWAGDSKIRPNDLDELGIPEISDWDKKAFAREVRRMNPKQRAAREAIYDFINEEFKKNYKNMSQKELMQWRNSIICKII